MNCYLLKMTDTVTSHDIHVFSPESPCRNNKLLAFKNDLRGPLEDRRLLKSFLAAVHVSKGGHDVKEHLLQLQISVCVLSVMR